MGPSPRASNRGGVDGRLVSRPTVRIGRSAALSRPDRPLRRRRSRAGRRLMGKRILVTGAGGFVGAAVVKAAIAAGHQVVALVRNDTSRLTPLADRISMQRVDLAESAAVATVLNSTKPAIVIHSAW